MDGTRPEERSVSPVGGQWRLFRSQKARNIGFGAAGLGVVALAAMAINTHDNGPEQKPADTGSTVISQVTSNPPPIVTPTLKPPPAAAPPDIVAPPVNYVMFPASGGGATFEVPTPAPVHEDKANAGATGPGTEASKTTVAFKPSTVAGGKAGPAMRLTYMLMPQLIPCALDTALDSTLAGAISCHTTQDVLSPDHVLLMPAGTQITGQYKNNVQNGQHRLFAFAGSAITKEGIPVPLDSDVGDGLGRTGIDGEVDNHYAERFGAALLLTAGDAALQLGQAELSKGSNATNLNFSSGGGGGTGVSGIASQVLQAQIGIPPTIYVSPGAIVSIVVAHPIDFGDAIRVAAR
jgi:type IV secretion system protein VirB10